MMVRRAFLVLLIICLGCSAQAPPSATTPSGKASPSAAAPSGDLVQTVERQVRVHYSLPPEVKVIVGPLRASEFPNYDAVTITFDSPDRKQPFEFLLSHDHKTLIRMTKLDLTQDPYAEVVKKIDVSGRPVRGNQNAKVLIVNYDDFECPFCSRMHATLFPEIFKEYGDRVRIVYKDYPIEEIHPWSVHAAVDADCLGAQGGDAYWDYADYLHTNQHSVSAEKTREGQNEELDKLAMLQGQKHNLDVPKLQACVKAQDEKVVRASLREGDELGVNATPTMFVNGQKVDGVIPADELRAVLDQALKDAGETPPDHKSARGDAVPPPAPSK
jgi:protein-disulfide isomerase